INHKLVQAVLGPFLPRGFTKSKVLPLFTMLEELRQTASNQMTTIIPSCFKLIQDAIYELDDIGTLYCKKYFVPIFYNAVSIVRSYFYNSDATKPAELEIANYPKKYPLQQPGVGIKLKFLLKNKGPGPAPEVDLTLSFGSEVTPDEAQYTFIDMDATTY